MICVHDRVLNFHYKDFDKIICLTLILQTFVDGDSMYQMTIKIIQRIEFTAKNQYYSQILKYVHKELHKAFMRTAKFDSSRY